MKRDGPTRRLSATDVPTFVARVRATALNLAADGERPRPKGAS